MKRDLDLVRDILLAVENRPIDDPELDPRSFPSDRALAEIAHHVSLLLDAGYVVGKVQPVNGPPWYVWYINRMTNAGHDYLDSVRDPEVYRQTKEKLTRVGGTAALEMPGQFSNH